LEKSIAGVEIVKFSVAGAMAVVVSFVLGFFARGLIETHEDIANLGVLRTSSFVENPPQTSNSARNTATDRLPVNGPDVDASGSALGTGETSAQQWKPGRRNPLLDNPQTRAHQLKEKREMLADFFEINGIDAVTGEQIVQDLVDLVIDVSTWSLERQATIDTENSGDTDGFSMYDSDTMQQLTDKILAGQRDILGIYHDAYIDYLPSVQARLLLNRFSSSLDTPLNASTKDDLIRILMEEARQAPEPERVPATPEEIAEVMRSQLEITRANNEAIRQRARSYLTPRESALLSETLEVETEQLELSIRMMELRQR
jgi:hypothetical protein